jgi:OmcA/MtrC family decaheme c-type cytochrome
LLILLSAAALSMAGASKSPYGIHEKRAYFTDANINFPGASGLVITINKASIAANGTISVTYTLTDVSGLPLDAAGINTAGAVSVSYLAAYIPNNGDQYTSYIAKSSTGTAGTFTVATTDSGGVVTSLGSGQYTYVYATKAPTGFDATATNTVAVYGRRTLTSFGLPNELASTSFNFVPNGSAVSHVRDIVATATCNSCHDELSHHGGQRRQVAVCIICHQPQSTDPTSGNTVDFKVMIHKIHLGSQLPSVLAGGAYSVSGTDFSKVIFPASSSSSDAGAGVGFRCEKCHDQKSGAAQANYYMTKPSAATCGSCHDDVNLKTGLNHPGGPQPDDTQCANCHIPQGELPFDASIKGAHWVPEDSIPGSTYPLLGGVQITLNSVTNGVAGKAPTINFTLQDGNGKPLPYSSMGSLTFVMAGPTTDYGYTSFGTGLTTPGYVTESGSATTVICSAAGACTYTFTHAIPANSTGTYAISFYGSRVAEVLLSGTTSQQSVTESPFNNVIYFSVDGSPVVNRRQVVAVSTCNNNCHYQLELHGGSRRNTDLCVMCHNPSNTDFTQRPNAVVVADRTQPNQGINFNFMIHRIHNGANLAAQGASYTVVGFNGSHNDFTTVLYPAFNPSGNPLDLSNCSMCHNAGTEQNLPLGKNADTSPQYYINPTPAITGACTGCHADQTTASHALSMTDSLGESCVACHSSTAVNGITPPFAVSAVHAEY